MEADNDQQWNALDVIAERFGCAAPTDDKRRACALYLCLLDDTEQLAASCPCQEPCER